MDTCSSNGCGVLKYKDIYLKGYADGREAKAGIANWISFYNGRRPRQALGNRTPMAVWRDGVTGALGDKAVDMTLRHGRSLDTVTRCPQAHSHNSNGQVLSRDGTTDRRRQRSQLRKPTQWPRRSGPLQRSCLFYDQRSRDVPRVSDPHVAEIAATAENIASYPAGRDWPGLIYPAYTRRPRVSHSATYRPINRFGPLLLW